MQARVREFNLLPPREQLPIEAAPFAHWRTGEGEVTVDFYRTRDGYTIRFLDRADFAVPREGADVIAWPQPGTSERAVRDLYLNQVLPMIRGQQGDLVIHASAVAAPMGALGFVAPTRRGKSTLAAAFARSGIPFLSDDGLTLVRGDAGYIARPNRPSFRLWQDSEIAINPGVIASEPANEKSLVEAGRALPFQTAPVPLAALYFLGHGQTDAPAIEPIGRQRAMAELINHSFLLDVTEQRRLRQHFDELGDLAEVIPCFTLDYPRDYAALPQVIAAVLQHAALNGNNR